MVFNLFQQWEGGEVWQLVWGRGVELNVNIAVNIESMFSENTAVPQKVQNQEEGSRDKVLGDTTVHWGGCGLVSLQLNHLQLADDVWCFTQAKSVGEEVCYRRPCQKWGPGGWERWEFQSTAAATRMSLVIVTTAVLVLYCVQTSEKLI